MKLTALLVLATAAFAQPLTFEVASVKVSGPEPAAIDMGGGRFRSAPRGCRNPNPATITCQYSTLKQMLLIAYDIKDYQLEGPAWLDSEHYELNAKAPSSASAEQLHQMLQALLAERFKVVIRKESREYPQYEMTVAKTGLKLKEVDKAEVDAYNSAQEAAKTGNAPATPPPPPPPPSGGRGASPPMGMFTIMMSSTGARTMRGKMDMKQIVNTAANQLKRPVIDKTGLTGTYDVELTYMDADNPGMRMVGGDPGAPPPAPSANDPTATFLQAVQQLGFKLEQKKAPLEFIIVESANKVPTEN